MKSILLTVVLLLNSWIILAQFGPQQIITDNATSARSSIPYDINNDGYVDVISNFPDTIVWHQNLDGQGNFSEAQIIAENILAIEEIIIYDLNSDGNKDIVYRTTQNKIAWLENIDGLGTFGPEQIIAGSNYIYSISVADIDSDGDMDVFANLHHNSDTNKLVWYKNTDGNGTFSGENIIEIGEEFYGSGGGSILLHFDLDNDGDQDLITSYERHQSSKLIWYENTDGQGNLSSSQELYQFEYNPLSDFASIVSLGYSDINGDGKIDIIASTFFYDPPVSAFDIVWLENIDGQGLFGSPQDIHNYITYSMSFYDLDNDGDNDVLSNYGNESNAADFNNDGLLDVVSSSSGDNKVAWYQNGVLGIEDNNKNDFILYPNPTNGILHINAKQEIVLVEVYNLVGQKIIETNSEVNLSNLVTGIYIVKIFDDNGFSETFKISKE